MHHITHYSTDGDLYKVRKVIKEEHAENIAIRQKKIDKKI